MLKPRRTSSIPLLFQPPHGRIHAHKRANLDHVSHLFPPKNSTSISDQLIKLFTTSCLLLPSSLPPLLLFNEPIFRNLHPQGWCESPLVSPPHSRLPSRDLPDPRGVLTKHPVLPQMFLAAVDFTHGCLETLDVPPPLSPRRKRQELCCHSYHGKDNA